MKSRFVILGAGLAGLSLAYHLKKDYEIFEREAEPGGLCRTRKVKGYLFDCDAHLLHFRNEYTRKLVFKLLDGNLLRHKRSAWIFYHNRYIPYPFQAKFYTLPKKVFKECLLGLMKAKLEYPDSKQSNFRDWIFYNFGDGIARHFMIPYNEKFWKICPGRLTSDWVDGLIPQFSFGELLEEILGKREKEFGYNSFFWYPRKGGIGALVGALVKRIKEIHTNHKAIKIELNKKEVEFENGRKLRYRKLFSSIPLVEMKALIPDLPADVRGAIDKLKYISIYNLNLGINRKEISDRHWIYFPEGSPVFFRIGFPMNFSNFLSPSNKSSIYTEVSYPGNKNLDKSKTKKKIIEGLKRIKILKSEREIELMHEIEIKYGYIIYDKNYLSSIEVITNFLRQQDIFPFGRYGRWKYMTMEDVIWDGKELARCAYD